MNKWKIIAMKVRMIMTNINIYINYSISVFVIVLLSGCILNLLKQHFIFQLSGIAFLFTFFIYKCFKITYLNPSIQLNEVYISVLPILIAISACLISMVFGFWFFPPIRKKINRKG